MKLNHLNLTVTDVVTTREFLERYFGMRRNEAASGNAGFDVLFDDAGMVLTLIKAGRTTPAEYPATFHIGFIQESEQKVNEINDRLKADGYDVEPPQRLHAWTFYVKCPGGFTVEVLG